MHNTCNKTGFRFKFDVNRLEVCLVYMYIFVHIYNITYTTLPFVRPRDAGCRYPRYTRKKYINGLYKKTIDIHHNIPMFYI